MLYFFFIPLSLAFGIIQIKRERKEKAFSHITTCIQVKPNVFLLEQLSQPLCFTAEAVS